MKKITEEEMKEILFHLDFDDPEDHQITKEDILRWCVIEFGGRGERSFMMDGQRYSIIVAPIAK